MLRSEDRGDGFEPRDFGVIGPKVLAGRKAFPDAALESRCLRVYTGLGADHDHVPTELSAPEFGEEVVTLTCSPDCANG